MTLHDDNNGKTLERAVRKLIPLHKGDSDTRGIPKNWRNTKQMSNKTVTKSTQYDNTVRCNMQKLKMHWCSSVPELPTVAKAK